MTEDVLIVGAGPTGLALAAQLHAHGGRVRVIERRLGPQDSRAFVMHPRTLEVLAPLGVVDALVARGDPSARIRVHAGRRLAAVDLVHPGVDDTAYPFLLAIPQSTVEDVLTEHLARLGISVERGVELVSLRQRADAVDCVLRRPDGRSERPEAAYVVGCDGADSTVRRAAGIGFPGRAYRARLLLADLEVDGDLDLGAFQGFVGDPGIFFLFPSPAESSWRLLTVSPAGRPPGTAGRPPDLGLLQDVADRFTGGAMRLHDLTWSSTVRLRRGQASRYREGRLLLAGDAAHVHSPAGAQGMNTGIQDAANLGWKLAMVTAGIAAEPLLDTYQAERWPVARRVRQLTDLAFLGEAADLPGLGLLRRYTTPMLLPMVGGLTIPAWAFRFLTGLFINYRGSPAVEEGHPRLGRGPHPGDRLPDGRVDDAGEVCWLHDLLRPPGFHLLLCGPPGAFDPRAVGWVRRSSPVPVHVHRLGREDDPEQLADPDGRLLRRLGIAYAGVYLVRPDNYVAYRSRGVDLDGVGRFLAALAGDPRPRPATSIR